MGPPSAVTMAGTVDTSFGGGVVVTPVGVSEDYANAVAVQADGKVLVAGSTATGQGTQFSVVRHLRDGGLDAGFGQGGKAMARARSVPPKKSTITLPPAPNDGSGWPSGSSRSSAKSMPLAPWSLLPASTMRPSGCTAIAATTSLPRGPIGSTTLPPWPKLRPLDLLIGLDPALGAPAEPGYRLGRAPRCGGAIERVLIGEDGRAAMQLAWRQDRLFLLVTAWSEGEALFPEAARQVVCARSPTP